MPFDLSEDVPHPNSGVRSRERPTPDPDPPVPRRHYKTVGRRTVGEVQETVLKFGATNWNLEVGVGVGTDTVFEVMSVLLFP